MNKDLSGEMYAYANLLKHCRELGLEKIDIDIVIDKFNQFSHRVDVLEDTKGAIDE
jgi:hypothetical protein